MGGDGDSGARPTGGGPNGAVALRQPVRRPSAPSGVSMAPAPPRRAPLRPGRHGGGRRRGRRQRPAPRGPGRHGYGQVTRLPRSGHPVGPSHGRGHRHEGAAGPAGHQGPAVPGRAARRRVRLGGAEGAEQLPVPPAVSREVRDPGSGQLGAGGSAPVEPARSRAPGDLGRHDHHRRPGRAGVEPQRAGVGRGQRVQRGVPGRPALPARGALLPRRRRGGGRRRPTWSWSTPTCTASTSDRVAPSFPSTRSSSSTKPTRSWRTSPRTRRGWPSAPGASPTWPGWPAGSWPTLSCSVPWSTPAPASASSWPRGRASRCRRPSRRRWPSRSGGAGWPSTGSSPRCDPSRPTWPRPISAARGRGQAAATLAEDVDAALVTPEGAVAWVGGRRDQPRLEVAPARCGARAQRGRLVEAHGDPHDRDGADQPPRPGRSARSGDRPSRRRQPVRVRGARAASTAPPHLPDPRQPAHQAGVPHAEAPGPHRPRPEGARSHSSPAGGPCRRRRPRSSPLLERHRADPGRPAQARVLLARFSAEETSCLFATAGLFQGIDVPGRTLSLVTIDRLPFPRPDEPLLKARRERLGPEAFRGIDLHGAEPRSWPRPGAASSGGRPTGASSRCSTPAWPPRATGGTWCGPCRRCAGPAGGRRSRPSCGRSRPRADHRFPATTARTGGSGSAGAPQRGPTHCRAKRVGASRSAAASMAARTRCVRLGRRTAARPDASPSESERSQPSAAGGRRRATDPVRPAWPAHRNATRLIAERSG